MEYFCSVNFSDVLNVTLTIVEIDQQPAIEIIKKERKTAHKQTNKHSSEPSYLIRYYHIYAKCELYPIEDNVRTKSSLLY